MAAGCAPSKGSADDVKHRQISEPATRPAILEAMTRISLTQPKRQRAVSTGLVQIVHCVVKDITVRVRRRRGQPRAPSPASAALAALRPHTPWTPPPGVAPALPR